MKVLFFSLSPKSGLYLSLAEEFVRNGHEVCFYSPSNKNEEYEGHIKGLKYVFFKAGALTQVGLVQKAVSTATFPGAALKGLKKYINPGEYQLVMLSTPTIAYYKAIKFIRRKNPSIKFYLILRDIYPEAIKASKISQIPFVYGVMKNQAQKVYQMADKIGCMSPHSVALIQNNYCQETKDKVCLLENWGAKEEYIYPDLSIREKYGLDGKFIVIYGGNLGVAQKLGHILDLAKLNSDKEDVLFLFIGKGTQSKMLKQRISDEQIKNVQIWDEMPRDEYEQILKTADLGLISLRTRAQFANIPSKTVSYMANKIPILASIDKVGDYRSFVIDRVKCGLWAFDDDLQGLSNNLNSLYYNESLRKEMGENGRAYFDKYLTADKAYNQIVKELHI